MKNSEVTLSKRMSICLGIVQFVTFVLSPLIFNPFEPTLAGRLVGWWFYFPMNWPPLNGLDSFIAVIIHFVFWAFAIFTVTLVSQIIIRKLRGLM
jgi:hypothetical protein